MKILLYTLIGLISLINKGFNYVVKTTNEFNIDESHALKHSMEVYRFAKQIYENEVIKNPSLESQKEIIFMAAIGHDMCDKKYMDEKEGIKRYQTYLSDFMSHDDLVIIGKIIGTMSYSKVKENGYPDLGEYQLAYHIVREADLLAAYDIDRCLIYNMFKNKFDYDEALTDSFNLFDFRVFKMIQDNLFITKYSKKEAIKLHNKAKNDVEILKKNIK